MPASRSPQSRQRAAPGEAAPGEAERAPDPGSGPHWTVERGDGQDVVALSGDWLARSAELPRFAAPPGTQPLRFDTRALGRWDSGLIAFLWDAKLAAAERTLDTGGLPQAVVKLLDLLPGRLPEPAPPAGTGFRPLTWVGARTLGLLTELGATSMLLGTAAGGFCRAVTGRAGMRAVDLSAGLREAGPAALLIVSVVNFLTGAILAFVGAVQLRKFAADIYVANLVGLAMVREMAAVMTAIVMAGRTGGAYAARIATMQGNEEIDALTVIGIPVADYVVLPAVLALVLTMPFLYLYGCLVGMLGGFAVAVSMLDVTGPGYLHQTTDAMGLDQFVFGFVKSIAFAVLIGVTSCRIGLGAGRSAADVGMAATRAVVTGIVGVIALDAVFAVVADVLGI